jgi:hypothetical protein
MKRRGSPCVTVVVMLVRGARGLAAFGVVGAMALGACGAQPGPTGAPTEPTTERPTAVASPPDVSSATPGDTVLGSPSPTATEAAPAPDALDVACTATGTTTVTDRVAAQPDGVRFHVTSPEVGRAFEIDNVGADNAPSPSGTLVWPLAPGTVRVWCGPSEPAETDWVAIEVVDPLGVYVPVALTCSSAAHGSIDYAEGARGERGDPVAIARRHLEGLRPDDTVERAGYPATADRKVRVMRGGSIAWVGTFISDGKGGWLIGATDTCAGVEFGWKA